MAEENPKVKLPKKQYPFSGVCVQKLEFENPQRSRPPFNSMIVELEPNAETPDGHQHPFPECWVVLSGKGILLLDGCSHEVSEGDTLYYESNSVHQIKNTGKTKFIYLSIDWLD